LQLLNYINSATKASDDGIIPFRTPVAEVAILSGSKRPREQSDHGNITGENVYERGKRRKPATPSIPGQEIADIEGSDDIELGSSVSTTKKKAGKKKTAEENAEEEKADCQKISGILAKKILDGLENQKRSPTVNTQFIEGFSNEAPSIEGSSIEQDPSKYFESQLWLQSYKFIDTAKTTAWKYRFLASCFRLVRAGKAEQEVEFIGSRSKAMVMQRWSYAAGIINMIVNGLAEAWGEKADLVYEALAGKNLIILQGEGFI
jgi:hypothetical protein